MTDVDVTDILKDQVRWEFTSRDGIKELIFEKEIAIAILLIEGVIFINNHWWMKDQGWPEDACKRISLNVNQNDVMMWGCADAETLDYADIEDVYSHWEKDRNWGTAIWYCKKLNMMPQKPVADRIRSGGIWDIDQMGLQPNPTDSDFA